MANDERRPLLYQRQSRISRQPSPERVGKYRKDHSGGSSHVHTVLNCINVMAGVGVLSLPLAMRYAGWVSGICLLSFSAVITGYTAKVLARCMATDKSLKTYVDVAGASFGMRAQVVTSMLFSLNMIAACVALLILAGDTLSLLAPSLSTSEWKLVCALIVLPMQFVSFRVLAPLSILGVLSCIGIVVITIVAGLIRSTSPGSLIAPAPTSFMPESGFSFCIAIGLSMAPFGANASFPTFYREMKGPHTYGRAVIESFTVTYALDIAISAAGYRMFGSGTVEEITYNILSLTPGSYPHVLLVWLIGLTAIMPITKITLSSRPLIIMIEDCVLGIDITEDDYSSEPTTNGDVSPSPLQDSFHPRSRLTYHMSRVIIRFLVIALIVGISVMFPAFDKVISVMGAGLCYAISVILPLLFYLQLLSNELTSLQKGLHWALIFVSCILAILGTSAALMSS